MAFANAEAPRGTAAETMSPAAALFARVMVSAPQYLPEARGFPERLGPAPEPEIAQAPAKPPSQGLPAAEESQEPPAGEYEQEHVYGISSGSQKYFGFGNRSL